MGDKLKLPQGAYFYLWDQLIEKRKPIQKAVDNTYAFWKGLLGGEPGFPDEAEARRLLKQAAAEIRCRVTVESKDESLVLTPEEARQLLRCSRWVIYEAIRRGTIPSLRISPRKIIIPKHRFLEWLNEGGGKDLHPTK